ncbi:hypothetical protein RFI_17819 [Reticulomyxa filosa]|uniref:Uncharacterized protein n=1 Tax=Reticulomyxa filosa TaxID=46433 RepID=X6N291_RETFI|nr:hypothetical protein RFI_17819 [Reticulomyxa filosa]|eukprot:ETO19407.1 hypothetical protein RFI_17819 [Reticulomyxa filosa]
MEEDESGMLSSPNPPSENDAGTYTNAKKKMATSDAPKQEQNKKEKNFLLGSQPPQSKSGKGDEKITEKSPTPLSDMDEDEKAMHKEMTRLVKQESNKGNSGDMTLLSLKANGIVDTQSVTEEDYQTAAGGVSVAIDAQQLVNTASNPIEPVSGRFSREIIKNKDIKEEREELLVDFFFFAIVYEINSDGSDHHSTVYQPPAHAGVGIRKGSGSSKDTNKSVGYGMYSKEAEMATFDHPLQQPSSRHGSYETPNGAIATERYSFDKTIDIDPTPRNPNQFANINNAVYILPSTDISQITDPLHPDPSFFSTKRGHTDDEASTKHCLILYHGANFVLAVIAMTTMALCLAIALCKLFVLISSLFSLSVVELVLLLLLFCKSDVAYLLHGSCIFICAMRIGTTLWQNRHCLGLVFFPSYLFPKFAMYIPVSHSVQWKEKFADYISDPHILKIVVYECFIKTPIAFFLSGICLILFSGVLGIMLSPLMYWITPSYFTDNKFCLFGSVQKTDNGMFVYLFIKIKKYIPSLFQINIQFILLKKETYIAVDGLLSSLEIQLEHFFYSSQFYHLLCIYVVMEPEDYSQ